MLLESSTHFIKPIFAIFAGGVALIADAAVPAIPNIPEWITSLGLPLAGLVAVGYALVATNKALRKSEADRHADAERFYERFERIAKESNESRERLIRATDLQTNGFRNLADHLKTRPCQKSND